MYAFDSVQMFPWLSTISATPGMVVPEGEGVIVETGVVCVLALQGCPVSEL